MMSFRNYDVFPPLSSAEQMLRKGAYTRKEAGECRSRKLVQCTVL